MGNCEGVSSTPKEPTREVRVFPCERLRTTTVMEKEVY